ncbi:hypothetical protein INQ48_25060 [Variovorax paradoxus]|nr:hypothetical protein INQ48_25060 [Variovorax paradoxus]
MLIYHPAFDAYHCIFRMLMIAETLQSLEVEKAQILDFYLMFPAAVSKIRLPAEVKEARRQANSFSNVYHDPINVATTFRDMEQIQMAALKCIAASELIEVQKLAKGMIVRTSRQIPSEISQKISEFIAKRQPVAGVVLTKLASLPLRGDNGLKHRTELMEHRYDIA